MQGQCWVQPCPSSSGSGYHTEPEHFGWVGPCCAGKDGRGLGGAGAELCKAEDLLLAIGPASALINSGLKGGKVGRAASLPKQR